jgi:glycosyltransferase involved in cell wall biosynthesis
MRRLKVSYTLTNYKSQARVARIYRDIIADQHDIETDVDRAHVVIVHQPPRNYGTVYGLHASLREKYVIACCVWQTTELPALYKRNLTYVQEVWTCSQYCCAAFRPYASKVTYMPYFIERDMDATEADRRLVEAMINYDAECFYFLTITRLSERRKNAEVAVRAFMNQRSSMPNAKLIVKADPDEKAWWMSEEGIIFLPVELSHSHINTLYNLADAYISAHHSESWGHTMSDAMLFGVPVIATGYSGNLEFMNSDNSFLIACTEEYIKPDDSVGLYGTEMKWAYPSQEDLEKKMLVLYTNRQEAETLTKVQRARADVQRFDRATVGAAVNSRLEEIARCLL